MATADEEFANYPKPRIAMGGGDLVDVYDLTINGEDGETAVHTLRRNPAGSTGGKRTFKIAFKSALSEAGPERSYLRDYMKRKVLSMRVKMPGITMTIKGRLTSPAIAGNLDSFISMDFTLLGAMSFTD